MQKLKFSPKLFLPQILLLLLFLILSMADDSSLSQAKVHIVHTERPEGGQEPEENHIKTLASVLGSEDAAKEALVYSYKTVVCGFSAKLTPEQVAELSKQKGVLRVEPSRTYHLDTRPGGFNF